MDTSIYIHLILILTAAPAAAVAAAALLWVTFRDVRTGAILIIGIYLMQMVIFHPSGIHVGITLYPADIVFLILTFGALVNVLRTTITDKFLLLWLAFGAMLFASFLLGISQYKTMAGVEYRQYFYMWSGVLYFYCLPISKSQLRFLLRSGIVVGSIITMIICYRWLSDALSFGKHPWLELGKSSRFRVVHADAAYIICQLLVIGTYYLLSRNIKNPWLPTALALLAIQVTALEHRTVWVTTIVSFTALSMISPTIRSRLISYITYIFALTILTAISVHMFSGLESTFHYKAFVEPFKYNSTFAWRLDTWQDTIQQIISAGPLRWLIGYPFGHGYYHYIEVQNAFSHAYPHDYYLSILSRTGLIGLALFLASYFTIVNRLWAARHRGNGYYDILLILIISQLTFDLTYNPSYIEAIFFGVVAYLSNKDFVSEAKSTTALSAIAA